MMAYNLVSTLFSMFDKKLQPKIGKIALYRVDDNLMSPTLKKNYVVITKKCSEQKIEKNDLIVFWENEMLKIQRVMNIDKSEIDTQYAVSYTHLTLPTNSRVYVSVGGG